MSITLYARQCCLLVLLFGLVSLLPLVFNQGVASAYHFKSNYYLTAWQAKTVIDEPQYRDALAAATKAYNLNDTSPHYGITLAKVMEWGVYSGFDAFSNDEFNHLFSRALNLRHNWPAAYSDYAFNLAFYQDRPDLAFEQLRAGLDYGQFAPEVVQQVLSVGFAHWDGISMQDKYLVFEMLKTAAIMGYDTRRHLVQVIATYQKKPLVCSYLSHQLNTLPKGTTNWIEHTLCKKM
ncbi:hypothetical protein [Shewanella sp. OMA3-2]|uniref:hypothetical protein n=1 Tax=Shewanella sp. OMA3-2 TaxID=2908650 RepID=UPI001F3FC5CC|nr:hypothetical protein [Shewanella sp. OMA3-2]UJF23380.1 hypothetical protein L0B17_08795 [Shewanella sp. OMA3-2]